MVGHFLQLELELPWIEQGYLDADRGRLRPSVPQKEIGGGFSEVREERTVFFFAGFITNK